MAATLPRSSALTSPGPASPAKTAPVPTSTTSPPVKATRRLPYDVHPHPTARHRRADGATQGAAVEPATRRGIQPRDAARGDPALRHGRGPASAVGTGILRRGGPGRPGRRGRPQGAYAPEALRRLDHHAEPVGRPYWRPVFDEVTHAQGNAFPTGCYREGATRGARGGKGTARR